MLCCDAASLKQQRNTTNRINGDKSNANTHPMVFRPSSFVNKAAATRANTGVAITFHLPFRTILPYDPAL